MIDGPIVPAQRKYHADHQAALARMAAVSPQLIARKAAADIAERQRLQAVEDARVTAEQVIERRRMQAIEQEWTVASAAIRSKHTSIQLLVCRHYGISRDEMTSSRRTAKFVLPRSVAMFLIREFMPTMSLPQIGSKFGGRDHTTVLFSYRKIKAHIVVDAAFADEISSLRRKVMDEIPDLQA